MARIMPHSRFLGAFTENSYGGRGVGVRSPVRIFPQYFYRLSSRRVRLFLGYGALISLETIRIFAGVSVGQLQLSTRDAVVSNCQSTYHHRDKTMKTRNIRRRKLVKLYEQRDLEFQQLVQAVVTTLNGTYVRLEEMPTMPALHKALNENLTRLDELQSHVPDN